MVQCGPYLGGSTQLVTIIQAFAISALIVQQYYCNVLLQLTEFLKPLDSVPRSRRGWYFGAQLTGRPSLVRNNAGPGPPDYQAIPVCHGGGQNKAAFNCVGPRWTEREGDFRDPGLDTPHHLLTVWHPYLEVLSNS